MNSIVFVAMFAMLLVASPASAEFIWQKITVCPWEGTDEQGVTAIAKHYGFSEDTRTALLEKIKTGKPDAEGMLKKGERANAMLFCRGQIATQVVASWTDGTESVKTRDYIVKSKDGRYSYTVRKPITRLPQNDDACKNWFLQSIDFHVGKPAQAAPSIPTLTTPAPARVVTPPQPQPDQPAAPPATVAAVADETQLYIINLVRDPENLLIVPGASSRDVRKIDQAQALFAQGKVSVADGRHTFRVVFYGKGLNGGPLAAYDVPVANGKGFLRIPRSQVEQAGSMTMEAPDELKPQLKYPLSGMLDWYDWELLHVLRGRPKHGWFVLR